jgi:hypothetical protein
MRPDRASLSAIDPAEALRGLVKLMARDAARRAHATTASTPAFTGEISEFSDSPGGAPGNEVNHAQAQPG